MTDEEKVRLQKLENHMGKFPRVGLRTAIAVITVIFLLGWIALLAREYILTFHP